MNCQRRVCFYFVVISVRFGTVCLRIFRLFNNDFVYITNLIMDFFYIKKEEPVDYSLILDEASDQAVCATNHRLETFVSLSTIESIFPYVFMSESRSEKTFHEIAGS